MRKRIRVLEAIEAAAAAEELDGKAYVATHTTHTGLAIFHFSSTLKHINQIYIT